MDLHLRLAEGYPFVSYGKRSIYTVHEVGDYNFQIRGERLVDIGVNGVRRQIITDGSVVVYGLLCRWWLPHPKLGDISTVLILA